MDQAQLAKSAERLENLQSRLGLKPSGEADWANAYRNGEKREAVALLEQALTSSPGDPEVTLWWIRTQLELGEVPITALTAPLEEIIPALKDKVELEQSAAGACVMAGAGLLKREQPRLAVNMLAQGRKVGTSLSNEFRGGLAAELLSIIETELEHAPLRRESKQYLDFLEETRKSIQEENLPFTPQTEVKPEPKVAGGAITSKSILDSAREDFQAPHNEPLPSDRKIEPGSTRKAVRLFGALAVVLILLIGIPFAWFYVFSVPELDAIAERLALKTEPEIATEPALPESEQAEAEEALQEAAEEPDSGASDPSASALDQVGERIKQLAFAERAKEPEPPRSEVDPTALDPSRAKVLPRKQDDDLVSLSGLPESEGDIQESEIPQMDPGRFADTRVEDVGTTPRRAPVEEGTGALRSDSEGRIYGPPRSTDPARAPGVRGRDGRPVESHKVEVLDRPSLYRTITATEVLSAPSLLSQSLARLEANTPVHVTRRMGQWLELRSTGGRVGYIYAQDAVPGR